MAVIPLTEHKSTSRSLDDSCKPANVVYLPVAPQTVARTRFSPPPPPRSQCLMVSDALDLLQRSIDEGDNAVKMVAISGPGDPLATAEITLHAVQQIRNRYPELKIGIQTLGIGAKKLAADLARAGVDFAVILVDAVRADILEKIYAWIRPGQKTLKLANAVDLLIEEQRNGVPALKFHDLTVQVQTTVYPGYNHDHIPKISSEMLELGADNLTLTPYTAGPDVEVRLESPTNLLMAETEKKAAAHLPIASPLIPQNRYRPEAKQAENAKIVLPKPTKDKPNVAVVSSNGMEVDLHLGHAVKFLIYGPREDGLACLLETRDAPEPGSGEKRWQQVSEILSDCFVLLAASAGETPRRALAEHGLRIIITEENIEGTVDVLYGGGKKGKKKK